MRTRRSPRNQEILWRALAGERVEAPRPAARPIQYTPEQQARNDAEWEEAIKDFRRRKAREAKRAAKKATETT